MKTRLNDIAEQLEAVDRGCLPYALNDRDEIAVLDTALAELTAITKQVSRIRQEMKKRRAEFALMLEMGEA